MPPAGDAGKAVMCCLCYNPSRPVGQGFGGAAGLNVRSSSRVDDEFYQGIFNFQITIIDFIM
jgi:hypothetical protein